MSFQRQNVNKNKILTLALPKMRVARTRRLFKLNRNFCVFVTIVLTSVNVFVFIGFSDGRYRRIYNNHRTEELQLESIPKFRDLRLGRWDSSRQYQMFDNLVVGEEYMDLSEKSRVTLATQTDPDHFHHIYELTMNWKGPISVALFAAGEEERIVLETQLRFLRRCYEDIASKMVFHLAVPKTPGNGTWNIPVDIIEEELHNLQNGLKCQNKAFKKIVNLWKPGDIKYEMRDIPQIYPQNHLRNLARKNSQTSFVFATDVDIVPCFDLWEDLETFLSRIPDTAAQTKKEPSKDNESEEPKIAYVVPIYELDERATPFPKSKNKMVQLAEQGFARPLYEKLSGNQRYTNFSRWQAEEDSDDEIRVAYNVTKLLPDYEPFYVAPDTAPPDDERFFGYGFTRNTQVNEMRLAGFTFSVLSPAFAVHWGLQPKGRLPKWRVLQNYENEEKAKTFNAKLTALYGVEPSKPTSQPKPQPKSQPKPQPKSQPKPQPKSQSKPQPKPQPKSQPKRQPKPTPKSQPTPQPKSQPKPQPKPPPKSQPKPQPKPPPKSQTKPQPKPQPKSQPKPQPKQKNNTSNSTV